MLILKQSTAIDIRMGPFVDATTGVDPETGITLGAADQAEVLKANGAATVAMGGTFAAVTGADGWYDYTVAVGDVDTVGEVVFVVQDSSVCLPVFVRGYVVEEAVYDAMYAASAAGPLQSTTAGRTLDVTATGAAGIDWGNVENPTTTVGLTGTTVDLVTDAVDATSVATGAIDADALAADAGTEIGTAVWASVTRVLTANTNLNDPTAATIADAVWDELQSAHVTAGSFGEIATEVADILADTNELQTDDVPGLIAALNDISTADVNTQVADVLKTDTIAELGAVPSATPTFEDALMFLYMKVRNEETGTTTAATIKNSAGDTIGTSTLSESGGTAKKGKYA